MFTQEQLHISDVFVAMNGTLYNQKYLLICLIPQLTVESARKFHDCTVPGIHRALKITNTLTLKIRVGESMLYSVTSMLLVRVKVKLILVKFQWK